MTHLYWVALKSIWAKEINRFMRIWVQTLVPPVITMTLYFIIFGNLIGSRIGEMHGFTYMQFIVPGLIMMAVITNAYANVASSFFSAKFQRNIEELLVAPVPTHVIIAGYVGGGVARGLCVGILVTAISLFFVPFQVHSWLFVALTLLLTAILFSLAGLLNAVFAKTFDDISLIPTFVLTPLTYLGGVFYSLTLLPPFWQALSHLNPIVYMISGFRFGFLGITDVPLFTTVAVLVVFIIAFYLLCWYLIQRGRGCAANLCPATFCLPGTFFDSYHRKLTFTPLNYLPAKEGVMLGWVITCHDEQAQEMLDKLEARFGPLVQCRAVNYWRGLSTNMLSRMMCDALHETDTGDGVIFLTDKSGAAPYRAAALMSHKHAAAK
jgi:ABC-2 type transport system permease protein